MILSCHNIGKAFSEKVILKDAGFFLEDHEKAAVVGVNGAGKSTLLKILIGEMTPDTGEVVTAKDKTIGYLAQHQDRDPQMSIYEEVKSVRQEVVDLENRLRSLEEQMKHTSGEELEKLMERYTKTNHEFEMQNGYALESEITGVLKGLGFTPEEFDKKLGTLSGGQKTRVALARLLLSAPDLILLDEPTNHLDLSSIIWLETFLINYKGAVVIVSHDRYFLDRIATKIIEVDLGRVTVFKGNYSDYAVKKKALLEAAAKAYEKQQDYIAHEEAVIAKLRSFNREKSIKRAESRVKALEKIDRLDRPRTGEDSAKMQVNFSLDKESGKDVLTIRNLCKSYGSQVLFSHADIDIRKGERVAVIGSNGTGKTTLLRIINSMTEADEGTLELGANVEIGYYDQEQHLLTYGHSLFEEISDDYPEMTNTEIRNLLASFLFTGDDVFKLTDDLSGGERGRLSLAKLMLSSGNFLILDEPTNHLDFLSKEILEDALNRYEGTLLYVSHDRYFINRTATRILELENGSFTQYLGNYDYYLEKKQELLDQGLATGRLQTDPEAAKNLLKEKLAGNAAEGSASGKPNSGQSGQNGQNGQTGQNGRPGSIPVSGSGALDYKAQKAEQARLRKLQNDLKKVEERIEELEGQKEELTADLSKDEYCSDPERLMELSEKIGKIEEELESLYLDWERLSEEN